jgi:hypothetical protein
MDNQRDIQSSGGISRFFDKSSARTGLSLNQSVDRLYRRAERIIAGLFLATNHVAPSESLRVEVRRAGLELLEHALSLRDEMRAPQSEHVSAFKASARYLISLLRMLTISGFLSMQNSTVLIEAIEDLGNFLTLAQNSPLSETVSFSKQDFLDINPEFIKDIKDNRNLKDKTEIRDGGKASDISTTKRTLDVRKQGILEILRTGGELGITDISSNLPEYSTKMIQRDLAELVALGQVKKAGLKRWSRYSLAG